MLGTLAFPILFLAVAALGVNAHGAPKSVSKKEIAHSPPPKQKERDITTTDAINPDCEYRHRPHPTDAVRFETFVNGKWVQQTCPPPNLIWDQNTCRCEFPPRYIVGQPCVNLKADLEDSAKYKQLVNGRWYDMDCRRENTAWVFSEISCRCTSKNVENIDLQNTEYQCDIMLNVSFDDPIEDTAKGAFIERPWTHRIQVGKVPGSIGGTAAHIIDSILRVFYFAGNSWSETMQVFISFRVDDDDERKKRYQTLITNGCNHRHIGKFEPTVALNYRAIDGTLQLQLHTNTNKTLQCQIASDFYSWHSVAILYQDSRLQVVVDGYLCLSSSLFSGPVRLTQCPLTLAGDPLGRNANFRGYLDELLITRYCRV